MCSSAMATSTSRQQRRQVDPALDRASYDRFHDFQRTIDINYLGPVKLVLALLPSMRERRQGHIVNVSTIGVRMPPAPRWAAYLASKAAFDVWLRTSLRRCAATASRPPRSTWRSFTRG